MSSKLEERKLPRGWEWATLGEICEINPRKPKDFVRDDNDPTTFVPMKAVNGIKGEADIQRTEPYGELKKGYTYFINGDVLFAKITPCMQNGKHFIAKDLLDEIGFASTEFHVLRPNALLFAEWVHFYLRQPSLLKQATYHFTGAVGQQRVPASFLRELEIPLPPLSEQKRIVSGLNKKMTTVEKARAATLERVEAIRALPAAFLREIFSFDGGKLPQGWRWTQLGDICKIIGGTTPSTLVPDYWGGDINWVTPSDLGKLESSEIQTSSRKITRKALEETKLQILPIGTVVLSSRAPIGHLGIARVPFCTNQGCKNFIPSPQIEADYLYHSLKFYVPDFERLGSGATFKEISKTKLNKFEIPLPPLSEQKRIVADLNKKMAAVKKAREAVEAESEATHALPAAFLREAFGGAL